VQISHTGQLEDGAWSPSEPARFRTTAQTASHMIVASEDAEDADRNLPVRSGWNLLSFNIAPYLCHSKHLFGFDATIWAWNPSLQQYEYESGNEIQPFKGYWVNIPADREMPSILDQSHVYGFTPLAEEVAIRRLWNLIGSMYNSTRPRNDNLKLPMYTYRIGAYEQTGLMNVGYGYWLFATANGVLPLDADQIYVPEEGDEGEGGEGPAR
jgi:hypothetical protein